MPSTRLESALMAARDTKRLELGRGVLHRAARVFRDEFGAARQAVVVGDTQTMDVAGRAVSESFAEARHPCRAPFVFEDHDLYAEHAFVERLEQSLRGHDAVPVAVGAGALNDLAKLAAHRTGRPYLCVATAASMDGYTAYGASITKDGSKQTFDCPAPRAVIADIDVIRAAPPEMSASGYADLLAKVTAGADWILADALGVEPINRVAWGLVQDGLHDAVADPVGVRRGDARAIEKLVDGLLMSGFAMQAAQSSRPASGAEHQFSHLWDMQRHIPATPPSGGVEGAASHGFKVGIGTLAVARLYEWLLAQPIESLDVRLAVSQWKGWDEVEHSIRSLFDSAELRDKAIEETRAKYVDRAGLTAQLERLRAIWPDLRERLRGRLLLADQMAAMLRDAGAPDEPEQIGVSKERLRASHRMAYHLRRRFTVLDVVVRAGYREWIP